MDGDQSTLYSMLRFFVGSATTLLLAFVVLVVKLPSGLNLKRAKVAKFMLFVAYFVLGAPLFIYKVYKVYDVTAFVLFVTYLSDSLSYGLLLIAPFLILSEKYSFSIHDIVIAVLALCILLQCYFYLGYPIFGVIHSVWKWLLLAMSGAAVVCLGLIGMRKYRVCDRRDTFVRYFVGYYFYVLSVVVLYQILSPVLPVLDKAVLMINILFVLASCMFVLKYFEYVSIARVSDSYVGLDVIDGSGDGLALVGGGERCQLSTDKELLLEERLKDWVALKHFLDEDDSIDAVVDALGTDINTFRTYFRTKMPCDFRTWRITLRIEYAKGLLRENPEISMNKLSDRCGFATRSNFYYYFKKYTGMTPAEYKESVGK